MRINERGRDLWDGAMERSVPRWRQVLRDERGFFLVSGIKSIGKLAGKGIKAVAKVGVKVVKGQLGIQDQPKSTGATASAEGYGKDAAAPAREGVAAEQEARRGFLQQLEDTLRQAGTRLARATTQGAVETAVEQATESPAYKKQRTMFVVVGVAVGLLALTAIVLSLRQGRRG